MVITDGVADEDTVPSVIFTVPVVFAQLVVGVPVLLVSLTSGALVKLCSRSSVLLYWLFVQAAL